MKSSKYMYCWNVGHELCCTNCFQCYMNDMSREKDVPPGIAGKEAVIFGNMTEIYEFHSKYVCMCGCV